MISTLIAGRRANALGAVALTAVVCAVLVVTTDSVLRVIAGLLLAFVLPGPGLLWSCFPRRSIVGAEELVIGAGMSLGSLALVGLLLHVTGLGLSAASWAWSLAALTCAASGLAAWRISRNEEVERIDGSTGVPPGGESAGGRRLGAPLLAAGLAVVLVGASATLAVVSDRNQPITSATELSAIPRSQNGALTLSVRVVNRESVATGYQLALRGDKGLKANTSFVLEPGESWENVYAVPAAQRVDVDLALDGAVTVYRNVFISADGW